MMAFDKIANVYIFLKWGSTIFGNLLIKKNVNDMETVAITKYPVLCYLIFVISYYLVKYKRWYYSANNTKSFNPFYMKIIVNSIVDLFNSISTDAGELPDDYIYLLTTSKLYSQLNNTFKNSEVINLLKQRHMKYSGKPPDTVPVVSKDDSADKTYSIKNPIQIILKTRPIPNFKISSGMQRDDKDNILYHGFRTITNVTNCPFGSYHYWTNKGDDNYCILCDEKSSEVMGDIDRTNEAYYYNLNKIASRRCIEGTFHDFVEKDGDFICKICGRKPNEVIHVMNFVHMGNQTIIDIQGLREHFNKQMQEMYSKKDLDELSMNVIRLENENVQKIFKLDIQNSKIEKENEIEQEKISKELLSSYKKESGDKLYGQITAVTNKFIKILESLIGQDSNLDIDKYPVYLHDNVYIIDHTYNGDPLNEPIILTQKENRIIFKEDNSFFKTDVYYYTDNREQVDVFYHAVTLKLLGYKEKHKDYVKINKANTYLIINPSIRDRILTIGYKTRYIDISGMFMKNYENITDANKNYFQILDNLIREHIFKIRTVIDKFNSIMYKIKNYQPPDTTGDVPPPTFLYATQIMDKLIAKYTKLLKDVNVGENDMAFDDWNNIRYSFTYIPINWEESNVRPTENTYINSELINHYDVSSNLMIYYLINELISVIDANTEKITKTNIAQMYIEIIIYIYNLYNIDKYKNSLELKRFEYILNGSDVMVDILRKGQGLTQSKELEEQLDDIRPDILDIGELTEDQQEEIEDIKEEAESLDVESDYFAEDEDYIQEGEYEE